jgi:hypothetical protein
MDEVSREDKGIPEHGCAREGYCKASYMACSGSGSLKKGFEWKGIHMADIDGIDKRIKKLEGKDKHPPRIVWKGQEDNVDLKPGQKMFIIRWREPSDREQ